MTRRIWLAGGAVAVAIAAAGLWLAKTPERSIVYSLEAQQTRDGEPTGPVYTASAADTFEGGGRFRLRVQPAQSGFLYLINQGIGDSGKSRFWVLFPAGASAPALEANRETATGWYAFDSNPGVEKLWIVWSDHVVAPVEETLRGGTLGEVKDAAQAGRIQSILAELKQPAQSTAAGQASSVQWRAEGVMGAAIELRHR